MSTCRLYPQPPAADVDVMAELAELPTAILSDQIERRGGLTGLAPLAPMGVGKVVVGRALTVLTRPGDNLIVHKAVDLAEPGDFLVVDGGGALDRAVVGDLLCSHAHSRGVVALALDGVVRDAAELRELGMPIFSRGVNQMGPYKDGPGEIRGPVSISGTTVLAGDYVAGDGDGVVVIPRARAEEVIAGGRQRVQKEEGMLADIRAGKLDRSWLDELKIEQTTNGNQR